MLKPQTLRVLASGVDTLQFSARGELRSDVVRDLERWRDLAKAEGGRAPVTLWRTGTPFLVKDHGARGYSFVLTSDDMDITACSGKHFPPVRVELRSAFLHSMGPGPAVARVVEILTKDFFVSEPELLASRVDLYADLQGWELEDTDRRRFITPATFRKTHYEAAVHQGRRLSGFQFGKDEVLARVYDKTLELTKSGKRWVWDIWGDAVDEERPVWRLEFQFKRETVKRFQFADAAEVLWGLQDLWHYATSTWMSYRSPTGDARERRWPVDPAWDEVRKIEIVPSMTGLVRRREKELSEERTLRLMQGCLTSLAALHGCWTFAEAWERARPLVAAQFEERGRSFAALARDKAARRIGISVLDGDVEDAA
jgi:hypothetical protein